MSKIIKFFSCFLLIFAVIAVIGFVVASADLFHDGYSSFFVTYDGETILSSKVLSIDTETPSRFDVGYTFYTDTDETYDYYVTVKPYVPEDNDFEFTAGGETVSYSSLAETDVSAAFGLVKEETGFTLTIPSDTTLTSVIQSLYEDTVTVPDTADISETLYFAVFVTAYDEENTIVLPFTVHNIVTVENINITYSGRLVF